jgi:hypothetical protein
MKAATQRRHYDARSWVDAFGNVDVYKLFIPFMEDPAAASRLHFFTREGEELVLLVPSGYAFLVPAAALHEPYKHGVPPVACNCVVLQVTVGRGQSGPGVPLIRFPAAPTPLGDRLPAAVVQLVKSAESAGHNLNAPVHAQQGGFRALELDVGGASANVRAKAAVDASGGTVTFNDAGGVGGAAASSRAHASWLVKHPGAACEKGCGKLFDNLARTAQADRKRHEDGDGKRQQACAGMGQPTKAGHVCGKCGFCGKVGQEWKQLQQKVRHEETCPGRVAGGHDCPR